MNFKGLRLISVHVAVANSRTICPEMLATTYLCYKLFLNNSKFFVWSHTSLILVHICKVLDFIRLPILHVYIIFNIIIPLHLVFPIFYPVQRSQLYLRATCPSHLLLLDVFYLEMYDEV
jgi:hypothetical protein